MFSYDGAMDSDDPYGFRAAMVARQEQTQLARVLREMAEARSTHIPGGVGCACSVCQGFEELEDPGEAPGFRARARPAAPAVAPGGVVNGIKVGSPTRR